MGEKVYENTCCGIETTIFLFKNHYQTRPKYFKEQNFCTSEVQKKVYEALV